jgi:hypothetical protein
MSRRNRFTAAAAVIGALAVGAPVAGASAAIFPPAFPGFVNLGPTGPMGPLGSHGPLGNNASLPTGWSAWNLGPSGPLGPGGALGGALPPGQ